MSLPLEKTRVFVDMDGTLCEYLDVEYSRLYKEGHFRTLRPHKHILSAVKTLSSDERYEVFIMSSVLADSKYALKEKNEWLDEFLPEIDQDHRIFPPCGPYHVEKKDVVPNGIRETDILLDDYGKNVISWGKAGKSIKVSRDFFDSVEESNRHKEVVSPDDGPEELLAIIERIGR